MAQHQQAPPAQQQHQQHQQQQYEDMDDMNGNFDDREITLKELVAYSLRNYVFSLIGDMSSKLFVAPLERINVLHQTEQEVAKCGIRRDLGGVMQAPKALLNIGLGNTIWSGLVFQFYRTTFRCFTSSTFYILEPNLGPIIANPTYFFYLRPVVIDLLNLLCVYPIDTAATMNMADETEQPVLKEGAGGLVKRVLLNPRDSLRGFGITALGLVAYRASLATVTNVLVNNDWIPRGAMNRFLLQNAVLFTCTAMVYPFDTVRRRMIVRKAFRDARTTRSTSGDAAAAVSTGSSSGHDSNEESTVQAIKRIYTEEGAAGFFSGINTRMSRMVGGALFYGFIQYLEMRAAQVE